MNILILGLTSLVVILLFAFVSSEIDRRYSRSLLTEYRERSYASDAIRASFAEARCAYLQKQVELNEELLTTLMAEILANGE